MIQQRYRKLFLLIVFVAAVFFSLSVAMTAQTTVTVEGTITDEDGNPLPGAAITVKNVETGYSYTTVSRSEGRYILSGIQPGKYEIELTLSGFATQIRRGLTFRVGATLTIDFTLTLATLEEEVTVTAESPMVEVTKSEVSGVVDRQKIDSLPLYDRNYSSLILMKPGVAGGRTSAQPRGGGEMLIDGVSNTITAEKNIKTEIPADAIQEYRVLTQQMMAEYGNASGMVQSAITRSGTNEFKGRVSFFYRDEAFDTVNYFVNHERYEGPELDESEYEKPKFEHYNYAGFLGGPIVKDKFHFFIAYDGFRHTDYATITSPLVPRETVEVPHNAHKLLLKLNYQPSERHLISFRYSYDLDRFHGGVGGYLTKTVEVTYDFPYHDFQLNWTFYPSDNTMNEFRLLYTRVDRQCDTVVPKTPETIGNPETYFIQRPSGYFGPWHQFPQTQLENRINFVDHFSIFAGNHSLKFGGNFTHSKTTMDIFFYKPGIYMFDTDAPFDPTNFFTYPIMLLTNLSPLTHFENPWTAFAVFAQDSWKIHPRLTLNLGLRYNYYEAEGFDINHSNIRNFNPRFGFSWDPVGDGKTQIRGGIGTFSNAPLLNSAQIATIINAMDIRVFLYPGYPDPSKPNPFLGFDYVVTPPRNIYDSIENQIAPYTVQATIGFQREVAQDLSVGADLVWAGGRHIMILKNLNGVIPGTGSVRPDPTVGDWIRTTDHGRTDYKALYLTLVKRYSRGWSLDISYTLSKSLSHINNAENVYPDSNEPDNWERQWGPVDRDARHRLAVTGIVDLPLGFQMSGLFYFNSAYPWNAVYAADLNLDSLSGDYVDRQRNSRRGFDNWALNLRISKFFDIDRFRIHPFLEVYNVTNRTNFTIIDPYIDGTRFGEPIAAGSPRLIQLGLRIDF